MGSFHRRIVVRHRRQGNTGEVRAALEDDFHHFRVELRHESEHLVHVQGLAVRNPYSLCPTAAGQLTALLGMRLDRVASAVNRATDASLQCTHLLDLSGLAIALAAAGREHRQYDIEVADRVEGRTTASLRRDGKPVLAWQVMDTSLTAPPPYADVSLRHGLARWALETLDAEEAEAAIVLRRCVLISLGRHKDLDAQVHAVPTAHCYVQQPVRAQQALRVIGSTQDHTGRAEGLCSSDATWLRFEAPA